MFLSKLRIAAVVMLLAAGLAAGAAGVFAQQGSGKNQGPAAERPGGKSASGSGRAPSAGSDPAPVYIQASRAMIIARLEQELRLAEQRLDRTIERVESPDDPEAARARKTVGALSGLLARVDVALVAAVDQFPTLFDFTGGKSDRTTAARPPKRESASPAARKTSEPAAERSYDEHSLGLASDRLDWAKRILEKGYVSQTVYNSELLAYEALRARIDSDIATAHDRVEWAKKMHEKGYLTKAQYEREILRHYDSLKARLSEKGLSPRILDDYESLKARLKEEIEAQTKGQPANPAAGRKPGSPNATPKDNTPRSPDSTDRPRPKDAGASSPDISDPAKPKDASAGSPDTTDPAKPKDASAGSPDTTDPAKLKDTGASSPDAADRAVPF